MTQRPASTRTVNRSTHVCPLHVTSISLAAWQLAWRENTSGGFSTKRGFHESQESCVAFTAQPSSTSSCYWLQVSNCGQLRPKGREVRLFLSTVASQTSLWDERCCKRHLWKMRPATGHISLITQYHKKDEAVIEGLSLLDVLHDAHGEWLSGASFRCTAF